MIVAGRRLQTLMPRDRKNSLALATMRGRSSGGGKTTFSGL